MKCEPYDNPKRRTSDDYDRDIKKAFIAFGVALIVVLLLVLSMPLVRHLSQDAPRSEVFQSSVTGICYEKLLGEQGGISPIDQCFCDQTCGAVD